MSFSDSMPNKENDGTEHKRDRKHVLLLLFLCMAAYLLVRLPQFLDPFIRHDDYPTLLGEAEFAFVKNLTEGRWVNYWWTLRPVLFPPQANFVIYAAAWATTAALLPKIVLSQNAGGWFKAALALLVLFSPPHFLLSYWYTTVIPSALIIALHSLIVAFCSFRMGLVSLALLTPLSFMAYQPYSFILLTLSLLSRKMPATFRSFQITLGVFVAAFAAGLLISYVLNYFYHGVFGMQIASWRGTQSAQNLSDMVENLGRYSETYNSEISVFGAGVWAFGLLQIIVFCTALIALVFISPWTSFLVIIAAGTGVAPLFLQVAQNGVYVPVRSFDWLWFLYAVTLVTVALNMKKGVLLSLIKVLILSTFTLNALRISHDDYLQMPVWQKATKELAARIPNEADSIVIYGSYKELDGANEAAVQFSRGLILRLKFLTKKDVLYCEDDESECSNFDNPFGTQTTLTAPIVEVVGQTAFVLLPEAEEQIQDP